MPAIENSETGSSRVTRSLRKRLTSVDTDSSSRPGTPVLSSLQTLQEAVTPSRRTTRRSSMSTPVPTPSKLKSRVSSTEVISSPARRSTRRRSLSTHEQEDTTPHIKSKEPAFDAVKEEETGGKSPEPKAKTTTFLSPISALVHQGDKSRSVTPTPEKQKTSEQKSKSPEMSPKLLKRMKSPKVVLKKEHIGEKKVTPLKNSPTVVDSTPEKEQSSEQTGSKQNSVSKKQPTPLKPLETSLKSDDGKINMSTSQHNTPSKKAVEESPRGSMNTENETTLSVTEVTQPSPVGKKGRPRKLKSVGFNNTADEDGEKSVFPKTPGLTKSKSYILDSSKTDANESVNKSDGKLEDSHEETEKDSVKDDAMEEDNEILNAKTPYKLKLSSIESSTPIQNTSIKKNKSEIDQKNTSASKESEESKEDFAFPKSWSHSVSGTVNDLVKIDSIISEESSLKKLEEEKAINKSANSSKSPRKKRSFHDDSDEDLMDEDDLLAGEEDEDEEKEEREREKSMFVDDEAMEVPEGEESMDSEERAYLEENEIPVYAESIGSEDTVEDEGEEEADEEDAAFVVSDTEEILQEESDSDDAKKSNKKYRRIIRNEDSSDEEAPTAKGKDDDDFCLIFDSSVEEVSIKEKAEEMKNGADSSSYSSKKEVKHEADIPENESSLNISMKSVKSQIERKSLSKKTEDQDADAGSTEGEGKEQQKDENDSEAITDNNASKKERKSLKNRKSVGVEQKPPIASEEGSDDEKPVNTPTKRRSIQLKDQDDETGDEVSTKDPSVSLYVEDLESVAPTDADEAPRNNLSKKERKSLSLSKPDRKSLKTPEKDNSEAVNSPMRRKSLKKQEDDLSGIEMETEVNASSLEETDASTEVELSTSKLSKKERKSLNKSKSDVNKDADSMRSPYKRKSLKNNEDDHDAGFDDAESETKSPNEPSLEEELNNQSKTEASSSSRNGRKSLSSIQTVEDNDTTDVEMADVAEYQANKVEKTPTKEGMNARMSLNKRKSIRKSQNHREDSEKESNFSPNESSHKSESDPCDEQGAMDGDDEDDKPDYMNSSARSDNPKSPKHNSTLKPSRKSNASNDTAESVRSPYKRKSIKNHEENHDTGFDDAESETKSPNESNSKEDLKNTSMSLNKSKSEKWQKDYQKDSDKEDPNTESDEEPSVSRDKSLHKTESEPEEEPADEVEVEATNDSKCVPKSPKEKNNFSLRQYRKSLNKSGASKGIDCEGSEEPTNVSQNSFNKSKSLKRTSTEDFSDETEEKQSASLSKSEKSILFVEDDSEDEPVSALEMSLRVPEEKSLNSSRINRKSMNQSICSPRISTKVASPRKTPKIASSLDVESDSVKESDDDAEQNDAEMSKVMEFLGEEESEKNSPPNLNSSRRKSLNKSKLDETFHLEPNNSMLSRRDSLHRNILKKSLNQSKNLGDSMNKFLGKGAEEEGDRDADVSACFSDEEEVQIVRKVLPDKGLSVSLSGIECKKRKSKGAEEQFHKSFTIGVSLRHTGAGFEKNDTPSPDSVESCSNVSATEKDDLEKVENIQVVGPYKPRNSLSKIAMRSADENTIKAKSKRFSLYASEGGASQSFVENLAEEKKQLHSKRHRKSNSFCGVPDPCEETAAQPEEPKQPKSQAQSSETSKSETKTDIQRILSRCDEILEAANRAKREVKLNAKKTKVKKPKWMDKEEKTKAEEDEVKIPLVSKKEIKRKEKMKKELAKAIKHSTAMLKTIDPKLVKKLKASEVKPEPVVTEEPPTSSKRLPADFLDELEEVPKPKKKKTRDVEVTPPSDKENSKRSSNKTQPRSEGLFDGQKKKKKQSKEILETASGTVIVEPVTPKKLKFQNGFRESPKTPAGFKVQDINDAADREKSKKRAKKLFATTGAFEENDVSISNIKPKKAKKPRLHIEEPVYALPKTQWTSSGMFIEEDIYTVHHPLANSTATQFLVSTLGGSKKSTKSSKVVSAAHMSTALNFKKNALFSEKVKREPARSLLQRNERKLINNRY